MLDGSPRTGHHVRLSSTRREIGSPVPDKGPGSKGGGKKPKGGGKAAAKSGKK
jgi:hypothetical protein